jgi:hypothetical protein
MWKSGSSNRFVIGLQRSPGVVGTPRFVLASGITQNRPMKDHLKTGQRS